MATFGFWDTLAATLGAALLVVLVVVVGIAVLGLASYLFLRKGRRS